MPKKTVDLIDIVRLGGGGSVDASTKITTKLTDHARITFTSGANIVIINAEEKNYN